MKTHKHLINKNECYLLTITESIVSSFTFTCGLIVKFYKSTEFVCVCACILFCIFVHIQKYIYITILYTLLSSIGWF